MTPQFPHTPSTANYILGVGKFLIVLKQKSTSTQPLLYERLPIVLSRGFFIFLGPPPTSKPLRSK